MKWKLLIVWAKTLVFINMLVNRVCKAMVNWVDKNEERVDKLIEKLRKHALGLSEKIKTIESNE